MAPKLISEPLIGYLRSVVNFGLTIFNANSATGRVSFTDKFGNPLKLLTGIATDDKDAVPYSQVQGMISAVSAVPVYTTLTTQPSSAPAGFIGEHRIITIDTLETPAVKNSIWVCVGENVGDWRIISKVDGYVIKAQNNIGTTFNQGYQYRWNLATETWENIGQTGHLSKHVLYCENTVFEVSGNGISGEIILPVDMVMLKRIVEICLLVETPVTGSLTSCRISSTTGTLVLSGALDNVSETYDFDLFVDRNWSFPVNIPVSQTVAYKIDIYSSAGLITGGKVRVLVKYLYE